MEQGRIRHQNAEDYLDNELLGDITTHRPSNIQTSKYLEGKE